MPIDRNKFITKYLDELNENISLVDKTIIKLKDDPGNEDELHVLLRALHTIKGSSRMLKFLTIEKIAHGLENVFKGINEKRYTVSDIIVKAVFIATDFLKNGCKVIRSTGDDSMKTDPLLLIFGKIYANEPVNIQDFNLARSILSDTASAEHESASGTEETPDVVKQYDTVRIKTELVDKVIQHINNVIIQQYQLKEGINQTGEIEKELEEIVLRTTGIAETDHERSYKVILKNQKNVLAGLKTMRKSFLEKINQLSQSTFDAQEKIFSLRMLPLELIVGSLEKMVKENAMELNKEIDFAVYGTDVLLDKVVLEKINDPVIHIVRNAIDHGIESPDERVRNRKNARGKIEIACGSEGGNIIIKIKDDGRGIDYDRIREKAMEFLPDRKEEIKKYKDENLTSFLFMSGFSTREKTTELSGRGVGLDIVSNNIRKLKGNISINTKKGEGTEFVLALPVSLATIEGFFITTTINKYFVPAHFIRELLIIKNSDIYTMGNKKIIKLRDQIIPIYFLSSITDASGLYEDEKYFVLIVESLGETIGVVVRSIIQYNSLIYKPLPGNLRNLNVVQGVVFDENFNLITILYIPEIINRLKRVMHIESKKRYSGTEKIYKYILVVDDSYLSREIEKSILESENYNVVTAADGVDGLEKLKSRHFHLIITDIMMPRMNGITFIENIRKLEGFASTPVIVISAVKEKEQRESCLNAGANAFIVKSDFDRINLLTEVRRLIAG